MIKVIYVMGFSPAYEEYSNQPRPKVNCWGTPRGNWVTISGEDWADLILKALSKYHDDYLCEVWQPDLHADKAYSANLQERLIHRNFPARSIKRIIRGKAHHEIYSQEILDQVESHDGRNTIFMMPATPLSLWKREIAKRINESRVLFTHFINAGLLLPMPVRTFNPLKAMNRWLINKEKGELLNMIQNLLVSNNNPESLEQIRRGYPCLAVFMFHNGMDLDYWKALMTKSEARSILGLPRDKFLILLSQRLVPPYQVDKFIEVLARIKPKQEFLCVITGHGKRDYEAYLTGLVKDLGLEGIVTLVGRVSDDALRNYFIAADLFATVPIITAGSDGAKKCMAIGTPIFHVASGSTYEFLKENKAGIFVDPKDYADWSTKLVQIIDGKPVKTVSRDIVENYFSWKSTADEVDYAIRNLRQ